MSANPDIIPAVRAQLDQAEGKLQIACKLLRTNGYPESADDLLRYLQGVRVYTQPKGYLHYLGQPDVAEAPVEGVKA